MRITSSMEYATRLMTELARVRGTSPLSAEKLSRSENVPVEYVSQILLRLKRAGLIESRRGLGGGYALSRAPEKIHLGDIVRAVEGRIVEGKIFESVCDRYTSAENNCNHQTGCGISPVWQRLGDLIEKYLDSVTLADLCEQAPGECARVAAIFAGE